MKSEQRLFLFGMIGVPALLFVVLWVSYAGQLGPVLHLLVLRSSLLLTGSPGFGSLTGGMMANILIALMAMAISLAAGFALGGAMISPRAALRLPAVAVMNVLRNSPWLVMLYAMLYLLPFEIIVGGFDLTIPPIAKAVIGLSLPVTANVAEVFRGGVATVPTGQWEAARALGYRRGKIMREVVLPQALAAMTPNLMTAFAALFIGTSLAVVTGTLDVLSVARTIIASDGDRYATALYLYVLLLFFLVCFPIAMAARRIERAVAVI